MKSQEEQRTADAAAHDAINKRLDAAGLGRLPMFQTEFTRQAVAAAVEAEKEKARQAALGLRVVCAWCKSTITEGAEPTSHGICEGCLAKQLEEL